MKLQEKLKSAGENRLVSVQCRSWSLPSFAVQLVFELSVCRKGKLLDWTCHLEVLPALSVSSSISAILCLIS